MKNILSENLLRFGVKNLSESQKRALTLKTIMETIDAHGLHTEVRRALTEADAPSKPDAIIDIGYYGTTVGYKMDKPGGYKTLNSDGTSILVMQSPTSIKEASNILGNLMTIVGKGNAESPETVNWIKQINENNYPAILWKIRYGSSFKSNAGSNYNTLCDWISKSVDIPSRSFSGDSQPMSGGKGPIGAVKDLFRGTATAEAIQNHLLQYNSEEKFRR